MIKFNYKLIRDEGNEEKIYVPTTINSPLPNLVSIEAPNSSGKSTLLNIIGSCFNGYNNKNINHSLSKKMSELIISDHQNIEFDCTIEDEDCDYYFKKRSDDKQIIAYKMIGNDKTPINANTINNKFELVYDIPSNPLDRLKELVLDLKINQNNLENEISNFRNYAQQILEEVDRSKNIEEIKKKEAELKKSEKDLDKENISLKKAEEELKRFSKFISCKFYNKFNSSIINLKKIISDHEKDEKNIERKRKKIEESLLNKYNKYKESINKSIEAIENDIYQLNDLKEIIKGWNSLDFSVMLNNNIIPSNMCTTIESIIINLKTIIHDQDKNIIDKTEMNTKLIEVLEKYKESNIKLAGVSATISEVIAWLQEDNKENYKQYTRINSINNIIENMNSLISDIAILKNDILNKLGNYHEEILDYNKISIEKKKEKLTKEIEQLEKYKKMCIDNKIDFNNDYEKSRIINEFLENNDIPNLRFFTAEQYLKKYEEERTRLAKQKKILDNRKENLMIKRIDINDMKNRPIHKYQGKKDKIELIINVCQSILSKLSVFNDIAGKLSKDEYIDKTKSSYAEGYLEGIAVYLGKKISTIRHINKEYNVKLIDIQQGIITTEENKIIHFSDMGTGQSQSAYLIGKLNTKGNKKIIALFDEISMMDQKSLLPVFEKLKALKKEKKLLLAIVVQKSDSVQIRNIEEEFYDN